MASCNCFQQELKECLDTIVIEGGFTPGNTYHLFIEDKFGNITYLSYVADGEGKLTLRVADMPAGSFMSFSGSYTIKVYSAITEAGEAECDPTPSGDPHEFTLCNGTYDCLTISFTTNTDETESQTIPDCESDQPEIDDSICVPQPYDGYFCPAVKKCIGIKANGAEDKFLNEKGNYVVGAAGPQGPQGPQGETGATGPQGPAGPNEVSASTATNINAPLAGNGTNVLALTAAIWGAFVNALTGKTTPVDADYLSIWDSVSQDAQKLSFSNLWNNYIKSKVDAYYFQLAGFISGNIGAGVTTHYTLFGGAAASVIVGNRGLPMIGSGNIMGISVEITNAQPATGSLVASVVKNSVATSVVLTIPAGSGAGVYATTLTDTFVAGDLLEFRFTNNASTNSATIRIYTTAIGIES